MNAMLDRLETATDRQRRFVDDASHELRSPLAVLRAELEIALNRTEPPTGAAVAARMLGDVARQERLVHDLLFLARAEQARRGGARHARRPRRRRVRRSREGPEPVVRSPSTPPGCRPPLSGGEPRTWRGSWPTSSTTPSATPSRSVHITLGVVGPWAELVIHDDGQGIPLQLREQIFERFARLDEERSRNRGGTGLGLAIASEIVSAHGGSILVEESSVGARMVVRLPAEE